MDKREVLEDLQQTHGLQEITSTNLHFSNKNRNPYHGMRGWWINISWPKFESDLWIVLCDDDAEQYAVMHLPPNQIEDPQSTFRLKGNRADLFISNPGDGLLSFTEPLQDLQSNASGFDFTPYLYGVFDYPEFVVRPSFPEEVPRTVTEGAQSTITVNRYERSGTARRACIEHFGCVCTVCGFDFASRYGELGEGFIHVHHLRPISQVGEEYVLDPIEDLRPVCPNCHAMLHRRGDISIEELRERMINETSP